MSEFFKNKRILVTGGNGTIGSEIVRKILRFEPQVVRLLSNDENGLFTMQQELKSFSNVRFLVGDIRDEDRVRKAVENIHFVFHAAALKHVALCEYNPFEAVKTNVLGTQNVIDMAMAENVERLITISTDKAVSPINVMGATKLLAERLTISAYHYVGPRTTILSCVRFGNVLDSRGSVVPIFREQIRAGGPVTITDPAMTRYVMSITKAAELVLKVAEISQGNEIFILKMPALRIGELAEAMIEELAPRYGYDPATIKIKVTGKIDGEKDHEELLTQDEAANAYETEDMFIILPQDNHLRDKRELTKRYTPIDCKLLSKAEIKKMLKEKLNVYQVLQKLVRSVDNKLYDY